MNFQTRKSPAATGLIQNKSHANATATTDPLQILLPRLDHVRKYGDGYRCECPIGHKSHGTLSVTETGDGTLLVRCWAGCETVDVLHAVGLELKDLFPAPVKDQSPLARRQRRDAWKQAGWSAAIGVLSRESIVVEIAAHALAEGQVLDAVDHERLLLAMRRIHDVREVLQ
ncbi:MAG TPA: hypothetical protein VF271_03005 [Rhodanobacteraceae bacterium]|nr:hypothetical protein [Oleiagrimonas sp.]